MKKGCFVIFLSLIVLHTTAQSDSLGKMRFAIGLSAPELLHAGIGVNVSRSNLIGLYVGVGPTMGGVWPTLNAEHRLYFGKINESTHRKRWFFRQSFTYFTPDTDQKAIALTIGSDLRSKAVSSGWTIDIGGFILLQNELDRENKIYPALRFQFYGIGKRKGDRTTP